MQKTKLKVLIGFAFTFGLLLSYQNCLPPQKNLKNIQGLINDGAIGNDIHLDPAPPQEKLVSKEELLTFSQALQTSMNEDLLGQAFNSEELVLKLEFTADSRNSDFTQIVKLQKSPREMDQLKIGQNVLVLGEDFRIFDNLLFINKNVSLHDQDILELHYKVLEPLD